MQNIKNVIDNVDIIALKDSFASACKDENFKEFSYKLNLNEDVLMKYTSRLEEAFEEYKNCSKCSCLEECKNKIKGYLYTPVKEGNVINFSYIACKNKTAEIEKNLYRKNIEMFDMPKGLEKANLKDIYKDDKSRLPIIKYFKEFIDNYENEKKPKGIYLHGSFGSGKTYLIAALFNEYAKKGIRSVLVYYPEFLRKLKASFQNNYDEKFEYVKKIPLLLLDDIGAENCSPWSRDEILGPILQYRMDSNLPTFFTSNLTLEELEDSLSITSNEVNHVKARRIVERIKQLTTDFELISKNRRN